MRKTVRIGYALGLGIAATLGSWLADGVRGQEAVPMPIVRPAIDAATLARATARGQEMISHPKWKAELTMSGNLLLQSVGPVLVCGGSRNTAATTMVVDRQTGNILWETGERINAPMAWEDEGLLYLEEPDGRVVLRRRTADAPEGKLVWETARVVQSLTEIAPMLYFGDQSLIAGEHMKPRGGSGGRGAPTAAMTVRSLDRKTGKTQWLTPVPERAMSVTLTRPAEGKVYVAVAETTALVQADNSIVPGTGFVMCVNAVDGKVLWKTPSAARPVDVAVHGAVVVTLAESGEVVAYDGQTSKEKWRTTLSAECDPAKSKIGTVSAYGDRLFVDKEAVFVSVTKADETQRLLGAEPAFRRSMEGGLAVLELQTGRQTGYFNRNGITTAGENERRFQNQTRDLEVHGDVVTAQLGLKGRMAINRTTLQLEWYIPTRFSVITDDVMYVNTTVAETTSPTVIVAVPLDAAL